MSRALMQALEAALQNGWTEEALEIEMEGPQAWNAYKAIMNGLSYEEFRQIVNTGGNVRYIPYDDKGF